MMNKPNNAPKPNKPKRPKLFKQGRFAQFNESSARAAANEAAQNSKMPLTPFGNGGGM